MSHVSGSTAIYEPRAEDMRLSEGQTGYLFLHIVENRVWIAIKPGEDDVSAAKALRRLAKLATESAEKLEANK